MPTESACRAEVERLHDRFVAWFTASADRDDFDRIADSLAPDFEMITPDGTRRGRDAVLDAIRSAYGRDDPDTFDIEVRGVAVRHAHADCATVRYEEWQETPDGKTSRISTALLRESADAPGGLTWVDVHETWMDGP